MYTLLLHSTNGKMKRTKLLISEVFLQKRTFLNLPFDFCFLHKSIVLSNSICATDLSGGMTHNVLSLQYCPSR